nr:nucleoside triphosphate pyrophosphohydrolase [Thermoleophilaceae bacterium]
ITRRLRLECPWDREQDERSIVPHTVEEAYELADAVASGDDAKLLDELGDVLFQVYFLALLMEERGAGDLGAVAEGCAEKLVRRHPHVFGEATAATAEEVRRNWNEIKRTQEGRSEADVPETLPSTLYARKLLKRSGSYESARPQEGDFERVGRQLLDGVRQAYERGVDPELALRAAAKEEEGR